MVREPITRFPRASLAMTAALLLALLGCPPQTLQLQDRFDETPDRFNGVAVRVYPRVALEGRNYEALPVIEDRVCKRYLWDPKPSPERVLAKLRRQAKGLGANGLTDFECGPISGAVLMNCWEALQCQAVPLMVGSAETEAERVDEDRVATGVLVNEDGAVLTHDRVVVSCRRFVVEHDGEARPAYIIGRDPDSDLALLRTTFGVTDGAPRFRARRGVYPGEEVVVVGFPPFSRAGSRPMAARGVVTSRAGIHGDPTRFSLVAPLLPGSTGGPVQSATGLVIGVTVLDASTLDALASGEVSPDSGYAIKAAVAQEFMSDLGVAFETGDDKQPKSEEELAARGKGYSVLVRCDDEDDSSGSEDRERPE